MARLSLHFAKWGSASSQLDICVKEDKVEQSFFTKDTTWRQGPPTFKSKVLHANHYPTCLAKPFVYSEESSKVLQDK